MLLFYLVLNILGSTLGLFSTFVLKNILDSLSNSLASINLILLWIGAYIASLVIIYANTSLQNILYDSIFKKSEHLYEYNLANKLSSLPLSFLDSASGRNIIDEVRYSKNTAVYTTYQMIRVFICLYTFAVAFATLVKFNIWFSLLFLTLTIPGIVLNIVFEKGIESI